MNGIAGAGSMSFTGYMAGRTNIGASRGITDGRYSWAAVMEKASGKTKASGVAKTSRGSVEKTESVVEQYKKRHPEDASHVDGQVNAGKKVLERNGVEDISRDDITMEEYQNFIMGLMNSISFDSSRMGDKEIVSISEKGWEQMKKDPDYEAWVLGYTAENRSVRNPFAAWTGGIFAVEKFGASIEEHHGQSVSMNRSGSGDSDDKKSWWEKRHERYEELLEEQLKAAAARRRAESALVRENAIRRAYGQEELTAASVSAVYEAGLLTMPIMGDAGQTV